ncbi:hypothetical protein ACFY0B_11770 [Streptomyces sp. NPDC001797]|uniref:Uncharacterized protein n=2 Tax=unclassified Streptomyces TaxID=2593676 RepID=A0ABV1TDX1_9ACTN
MSRGRVVLPEIREQHLDPTQSVRLRSTALGLKFADAVNVALAVDRGTGAIVTLAPWASGMHARWTTTRHSV